MMMLNYVKYKLNQLRFVANFLLSPTWFFTLSDVVSYSLRRGFLLSPTWFFTLSDVVFYSLRRGFSGGSEKMSLPP
jgi:hypothetical protein